jgi:hypothetical protein
MARQKKEPNRVDELLADDHSPEAVLGENGLLKQLSKRLVKRAKISASLISDVTDSVKVW